MHAAEQRQAVDPGQGVVGVQTGPQFRHVDRLMAFVFRRAAARHPCTDGRDAGGDLQALGGPAVGGQFQAGVFLLALLHVGVVAGVIRPGILIGLASLEDRGGKADAAPVVFHPGFDLAGNCRGEGFIFIQGKPRRGTAQGQAFAVAGVERQVFNRFVDQRRLGQEHILPGVARLVALIIESLFVQAHFAAAHDGLPLLVEADAVGDEQAVLAAVEVAMAIVQGLIGGREVFRVLIDIAGANHLVDRFALVHHSPKRTAAKRQLMPQATGIEQPGHRGLDFIIAPGVIRAAEVIDIIVAFRAEVVRYLGPGTARGPVAAPRKRTVIINHHLAARRADAAFPLVTEAIFKLAVEVQRINPYLIRTALMPQQFFRRRVVRHLGPAQQLITRHRALLLVLILGIQLQYRVGADVPVERQGQEIPVAIGMFDIGMQVFMGHVGAQAELLLAAKPAAHVGGQVTTAAIIGGHRHRAHILRALGHVIDHAAGLGNPALHTRQSLEQLHALLVLQGNVLLAGDGAAIDLVAAGGIQRETAHHEVFVVADGRIAVAHRGVIAQHFAEQARLLVLDQRLVEHRDRGRRVEQRRLIESAHRRGVGVIAGFILALDLHLRQLDISRLAASNTCAEQQAEGKT